MLTRIISGAAFIAIIAAVLGLNSVNPIITVGFLAVLAAMSVIEMLYNTKLIRNKIMVGISAVYAFAATLLYFYLNKVVTPITVLYVLIVIVFSLVLHKEFKISEISSAISFPIMISFAFNSLYTVFNTFGLAFLILVINFSWVCDTGAYFIGVTMGKHKLCPEISPKKTIEGAVGGIVLSLIVTLIIVFVFNLKKIMFPLLILTPVLCITGMIGDLFASVIKRSVGIKDYGKIIPGHGGILDRFDSILLIASVFAETLKLLVVL